MKIVHFSWEFPPVIYGGLGTFATEITQEQIKYGNEVTVFSLNAGNKYKVSEQWHNIEVYRPKTLDLTATLQLFADDDLQSWGNNLKFFADVVSYNALSAFMLSANNNGSPKSKYDIIDAHDWLGILGGMIAKKELNIPLVFHVHSTEIGRSAGGGSKTIKDIEAQGGKTADCVITVSNAMRDELKKLGFPEDKIRVCWNGIDPQKYNPDKIPPETKKHIRAHYHIADDETFLFFIGRLVTVKGPYNLIKAMPSILKDFPKTKLVLLGIGDMENQLHNLIDELNLEDHVQLRTEFVSEAERIAHYGASDVVILPSLYEPFGIVCTEAMAMAKPVVVGARGTNGMREQIINTGPEKCGVHMNPFDPEDIAWGVKQVLALSPNERMQMGNNGRKRAITTFSWDIVVQKTLSIYKEFV
jgi:glycogen(starch) synthase